MADEIDSTSLELGRALCTQAGMLFEDASAKAVLIGGIAPAQLRDVVRETKAMAETAIIILATVEVMLSGE